MADGEIPSTEVGETTGAGNGTGEPTAEELKAQAESEKKRANEAYKMLRKRDADQRVLNERLEKNDRELAELREQVRGRNVETRPTGDDPEPNAEEEPIKWLQWDRRRESKENAQRMAQMQAETEANRLNSFALNAETQARQEFPDYDPAMKFLVEDFRKELKLTGELDLSIDEMLRDKNPAVQEALNRVMTERELGTREAAEELIVQAVFEHRRGRTVRSQAARGGNPAKAAYELAKHRGWKGAQGTARTTSVVDDSIKEMERKRNLQRGTQTTGGEHEGGEPRDTRVYTYNELMEMQKSNPAEFRRVTKEIANRADSEPNLLDSVIRH